jgi:hypothetical protein
MIKKRTFARSIFPEFRPIDFRIISINHRHTLKARRYDLFTCFNDRIVARREAGTKVAGICIFTLSPRRKKKSVVSQNGERSA